MGELQQAAGGRGEDEMGGREGPPHCPRASREPPAAFSDHRVRSQWDSLPWAPRVFGHILSQAELFPLWAQQNQCGPVPSGGTVGILWGFLPAPAWVSCPGDTRGAKLAREDAEHNTDSGAPSSSLLSAP